MMKKQYAWKVEEHGVFTLYRGDSPLLSASASAKDADTGCVIDSREANLVEAKESENSMTLVY